MNATLLEMAGASLACDLRDVKVTCDGGPRTPGLAFARGNEIAISDRVRTLGRAARCAVVAHELAHVAQKRRGRRGLPTALFRNPAYRLLLEVDAAVATAAILSGRKVGELLPDDPDAVSPWGPAGHYWTSLTVMLAAGLAPATALRRAFFCQMPDQVLEFDAIAAAVDFMQPSFPSAVPGLGEPATPPENTYAERVEIAPPYSIPIGDTGVSYTVFPGMAFDLPIEAASSRDRRQLVDRQISSGLHCLTGRRGQDEVAFRAANSRDVASDEVAFGISLHCFGDSYSHQDSSGVMYQPIRGHAHDGHSPDSLRQHQTQYLAYVGALYALIKECFGTSEKVKLPALLAELRTISSMEFQGNDEAVNVTQSAVLRQLCTRMSLASAGALGSYSPETERISYWRQFHPRHRAIMEPEGEASVFRTARALGALWFTNP